MRSPHWRLLLFVCSSSLSTGLGREYAVAIVGLLLSVLVLVLLQGHNAAVLTWVRRGWRGGGCAKVAIAATATGTRA